MSNVGAWAERFKSDLNGLRNYAYLVGGSVGRLVLSLAYFVSVANGLTVSDFGLFATASATGIVLSRIAGFGFVSPLYRVATVKPRLIGAYTLGLILAFALSLPIVAAVGAGFYAAVFAGDMALPAFAAIVAAEVLGWRLLEVVVIVNNGLGRFARGASLVVIGSGVRAVAALIFAGVSDHTLLSWALCYLASNLGLAAFAFIAFYPRQRLRFAPKLYLARWRDSVSVASAEVIFYLQSELDKLLVLSLGGPHVAGLYAILMRLVDLTALPIRSFTMMLVQKLMKTPQWLESWRIRWMIEGGIAAVSIGGLAALGGFLYLFPDALGRNVAGAGPLVLVALLVPAFRNLVEYQSELLYARGRTTMRALVLALVGLIKAGLLVVLLTSFDDEGTGWIVGLNALFLVLWLVSAAATYTAFDWDRGAKRRDLPGGLSPDPLPGE